MKKIILASKSPRRKELLGIINIDYEIIESSCDESCVGLDNSPEVYVQKLSILKATDVSKKVPYEALIIGADTIVECDGKFLGKPKDKEDAYNMISSLSGRRHNVYTGICVMNSKTKEFTSTFEKTEVIFREIEHNEIEKYVLTNEPYDKAGSYAIQGLASCFIKGIIGDYNNVVGLPVYKLAKLLKEDFNFDILD